MVIIVAKKKTEFFHNQLKIKELLYLALSKTNSINIIKYFYLYLALKTIIYLVYYSIQYYLVDLVKINFSQPHVY